MDLTEKDGKLMKLNKGTSIYVSNSLVKPEIYRFSTKVSDAMTYVFPEMYDSNAFKTQEKPISPSALESLTFQDHLEFET